MTNHKSIQELLEQLFAADMRHLNKTINTLCAKNKAIKGGMIDGFIYSGIRYLPTAGNIIVADRGEAMPTLDRSLYPEMEAHLADKKNIEAERTNIAQMLYRLLKPCKSPQEIRDALPECLVGYLAECKSLPRLREAAYTFAGDERAQRQYEKLLPKIEAYSVAQLIL